jgi:hypothetical protein
MSETSEQEFPEDAITIQIVGHVKELRVVAFSDFSHVEVESYHNLKGPCSIDDATFAVFQGPDDLYYTFQLDEHPELMVQ